MIMCGRRGKTDLMVRDNYDGSTGEVVMLKECGCNHEPAHCGALRHDHLRAPIAMFDLTYRVRHL